MNENPLTRKLVFLSQLNLLDQSSRFAMIASFVIAILLTWAQWGTVDTSILVGWLSSLASILLVRFGISILYRSQQITDQNAGKWQLVFVFFSALTGLIWGSIGILMTPETSLPHHMLSVFVLAGMGAASLSSLYPLQTVFSSHIILSFLPLTVKYFLEGSQIYTIMGSPACILAIFLLVTANRLRHILIETLSLRHEKSSLIDTLDREEKARRQIEDYSAWNQRKYQQVIDNAADAIFVYDAFGHLLEVNAKACDLLGYSKSKLLDLNMSAVENQDKPESAQLLSLDAKPEDFPITFEKMYRRNDGSTIPVEVRVALFNETGPPEYVALARDISDRKEADRIKSEFIATVSHELRTPLTSVVGALDILHEYSESGKIDSKTASVIKIADRNARRLTELVNEILDFEKLESGLVRYQFEQIDLGSLLNEACAVNQIYAQVHNVKLSVQKPVPSLKIEGDTKRLMQVMNNLISNAIKFSSANGIVTIALEDIPGKAKIIVSDNGQGIPIDFQDQIFQRFSQIQSEKTQRVHGTGLGLPIAKNIVEALGGLINFKSELGKGTSFFVELPLSHR